MFCKTIINLKFFFFLFTYLNVKEKNNDKAGVTNFSAHFVYTGAHFVKAVYVGAHFVYTGVHFVYTSVQKLCKNL